MRSWWNLPRYGGLNIHRHQVMAVTSGHRQVKSTSWLVKTVHVLLVGCQFLVVESHCGIMYIHIIFFWFPKMGGAPIAGWFMENPNPKWKIWGYPQKGNLHLLISERVWHRLLLGGIPLRLTPPFSSWYPHPKTIQNPWRRHQAPSIRVAGQKQSR